MAASDWPLTPARPAASKDYAAGSDPQRQTPGGIPLDPTGLNFVAPAVATLAGFGFGAAYSTLLSKPWLDAVGKTEEEIEQSRSVALLATPSAQQGHGPDPSRVYAE